MFNFSFDFKFNSIIDLANTFNTEQKCIEYLELQRWNGNVISYYDSSSVVWKYKKNNQYKCKSTGKMFNIKTGTLFEKKPYTISKVVFSNLYYYISQERYILIATIQRPKSNTKDGVVYVATD